MKKGNTIWRLCLFLLALVLTAQAWATDVTLQDDNGTKYVNMPRTGKNTLTLTNTDVTTFKIYDDGGADDQYSNGCDGYLVLTAPEGYALRLSGKAEMESYYDYLEVYDNSEGEGATLLSFRDHSDSEVSIPSVSSTGRSMTLYFYSDEADPYEGLDLTVIVIDPNATYGISIGTATGGSVESNKTTVMPGETVTLTVTPEDGYLLSNISVMGDDGNAVAVTGGWYTDTPVTFTMPYSNVTVTPTFSNELTSDNFSINIPATGTTTATIPSGMTSFKVYDDGGADGIYSNNCDGSLVLTAPDGCVFQLSGSIESDYFGDKLIVYDGSESDGTVLIYTGDVWDTNIPTVYSTGQSVRLFFSSDGSSNADGLVLTVVVCNPYDISVSTATGGSVESNKTTAMPGETVTLTVKPDPGYLLSYISVTDANDNAIAETGGWYTGNTATFTMPLGKAFVKPVFTNEWTSDNLFINMPSTGRTEATIPSGVKSLKVYDNGGAGGVYSDNCNGSLVLTAPEDCVLRLSGSVSLDFQDRLTVYDTEAIYMLLEVEDEDGAIPVVRSTGRSMTFLFVSDFGVRFDGLNLTVEVVQMLPLSNDADNNAAIASAVASGIECDVTLSDRTFRKDGNWNTLCLPFGVTAEQMAEATHPLYGTTIKELDESQSSLSSDGLLTLTFKNATSIEAGKPYIVKWESATDTVGEPLFARVTLTSTAPTAVEFANNATSGNCQFVGQYSPFGIVANNAVLSDNEGHLNEIFSSAAAIASDTRRTSARSIASALTSLCLLPLVRSRLMLVPSISTSVMK